MAKSSSKVDEQRPEGDPKGGDAILKRMLQTKPKTHGEMVAERHKPAAKATSKAKRK